MPLLAPSNLLFTYSEAWGPYPCQHSNECKNEAWAVVITQEEYDAFLVEFPPDEYGVDRGKIAAQIIYRNMGVSVCDEHRKEYL